MQLPTDTQYNEYVTPAQGALEFATSEAAIRNLIQRAAVTVWRPTPRFPPSARNIARGVRTDHPLDELEDVPVSANHQRVINVEA
jgi:hypothetical protein